MQTFKELKISFPFKFWIIFKTYTSRSSLLTSTCDPYFF